MARKYELLYGYRHCRGETVYSAGCADTEDEAREWARLRSERSDTSIVPPDADPVCSCEVSFCPMKIQAPWYSYRVIPG